MGLELTFGGGLNENPEPSIFEASAGYNFDLQKDQRRLRPRLPFDLKGTATNAADVRGLLQLVKRDDTSTTLVQAGGTVYEWDGASTFTSRGTVAATAQLYDNHGLSYWSLDDLLVITDLQKVEVVKTWNGTTFASLTTGLGAALYAKYGVTHLGRMWLFNVKTGSTDSPHLLVASAFENEESYDTTKRASIDTFTTGREAFYMLTPDLRPINGVTLFHNELVMSTTGGRLYKLTGSSASNFAWAEFFAGSAAVGDTTLLNTGNDVMYMRQGGNIDSLSATQEAGDVRADDVSRWIPDTTADLTGGIAVYDQLNQKVLWFLSGKVLVLFKDILYGGLNGRRVSPWSVYTTQHASNFTTNAAKYMRRPGTTEYSVYFGDANGAIYDLNGSGASGDAGSSSIKCLRRSRHIGSEILEKDARWPWRQKIVDGRIRYRRVGQADVSVTLNWDDELVIPSTTITLKGPTTGNTNVYFGGTIYFGGSIYFNQGFQFAQSIATRGFSPVGKGDGFYLDVSAENNVRWDIDSLLLR